MKQKSDKFGFPLSKRKKQTTTVSPLSKSHLDQLNLISSEPPHTESSEQRKDHSSFMRVVDGFFSILSDDSSADSSESVENFEIATNQLNSLELTNSEEKSETLQRLSDIPKQSLKYIIAGFQLSEIIDVFEAMDQPSREYMIDILDEQSNIRNLLSDKFKNGIIFDKSIKNCETLEPFLQKLENYQDSDEFSKIPTARPRGARDPNTASFEELVHCSEIGRKIAMRIVNARNSGEFTSIEDLKERVKGIGESRAEKLPEIFPTLPHRKPKRVNLTLNTLPLEDIEKLPGIGSKLAKRIESARTEKPFKTVEDFQTRVKGVGDTIANKFFEN